MFVSVGGSVSVVAWLDNGRTTGVGWSWVANELSCALVWLGDCFRVSWAGASGSFSKWLVGGEEMRWVWLMIEVKSRPRAMAELGEKRWGNDHLMSKFFFFLFL